MNKKNSSIFFSKKAIAVDSLIKLVLFAIVILILLFLPSNLGLTDTVESGLSDNKIRSLAQKCHLTPNLCYVEKCEESDGCDDEDLQGDWQLYKRYYELCNNEKLTDEQSSDLKCSNGFVDDIGKVLRGEDSDGDVEPIKYERLSDEEIKDLENSLGEEFINKVNSLASELGTKPEYLFAVMHFETGGSFHPCETNSIGATGLIQFTRKTANSLGTSTQALCKMSRVEQLDYVRKYLLPHKERISTLDQLYLAVYLPSVMGKDKNFVTSDEYYAKNSGLDENNDGKITVGEIPYKVEDIYQQYYS